MSKNSIVVEQLQNLKENIQKIEIPPVYEIGNTQDLNLTYVENKPIVSLNNIVLTKDAIKSVSDRLKIKSSFLYQGKEINVDELKSITDKIKSFKNETFLYLVNENKIDKVQFLFKEDKRKETGNLSIIKNLDRIIHTVGESSINYEVNRIAFDKSRNLVNIELNSDNIIEVLKNDPWKVGIQTDFSNTHFNINPFLLRRICTNGMMAPSYGFNSNASQMKWNDAKVESSVKELFLNPQEEMTSTIIHNVNLLKNCNISISELNKTKNSILNNIEDEAKAQSLILQNFNPQLEKYYGDFSEKSNVFLKTADTNINAYDHFNSLTWLTSHLDSSKLTEQEQLKLNVRAADILFGAEDLDLNQIAPKIIFN